MKNKKVLGVAALAAMALIGSSFAYFNQTMSKENPFQTGKYDSELVEEFNPADGNEWKPGAEVKKIVTVKNNGTEPLVVRAKFDEVWKTSTASDAEVMKEISAAAASLDPTTDSNAIMNVWQEKTDDGLVAGDDTVVEKTINTEDWILGSDGWYYYKDIVKAGKETEAILEKVKLAENIDMGVFGAEYSYSIREANGTETEKTLIAGEEYEYCITSDGVDMEKLAEQLKKDGKLTGSDKLVTYVSKAPEEAASGYSDASYTLIITSQTVQATDQAVLETFGDAIPTSGLNWSVDTLAEEALTKTP